MMRRTSLRFLLPRLAAWLLVPVLTVVGWQVGEALARTLGNDYVSDTTVLAVNPHLEDSDENRRLGALGHTRDDAVLLGDLANSDAFRERLAKASGTEADAFKVSGTAVRRTRVITVRVTSRHNEVTTAVSDKVFPTLQKFVQENKGSLYKDTGLQYLSTEPVAVRTVGAGTAWGPSGVVLGLLAGLTVVAVVTPRRPTMARRGER